MLSGYRNKLKEIRKKILVNIMLNLFGIFTTYGHSTLL